MDTMKRSYQFGLYRDALDTPDLPRNVSRKFRGRLKCISAVAVVVALSTTLISLILYRFSDSNPELIPNSSNGNDGSGIISITNRISRNLRSDVDLQEVTNATIETVINVTNSTKKVQVIDEFTAKSKSNSVNVVMKDKEFTAESLHLQNPKPFIYEYSNPFPDPFKNNMRNMNLYPLLAQYRSSAHVKNLEELIKYITSKGGKSASLQSDSTPSRSIQFSGVYTSPTKRSDHDTNKETNSHRSQDQIQRASENVIEENNDMKKTQKSDLLYLHMPNNPGDVNLLAERKFRFSPRLTDIKFNNHKYETNPSYSYYRSLPVDKSRCYGYDCRQNYKNPYQNNNNNFDDDAQRANNKPFSIMLDVYPLEDKDEEAVKISNNIKLPTMVIANKPNFTPPHLEYRPGNLEHSPVYYRPGPYYPSISNPLKVNNIPYNKLQEFRNVAATRKRLARDGTDNIYRENNDNEPMKLMLHLNLYPRNNLYKTERSTNADEYAYSEIYSSTELPKLKPLKEISMYDANQDTNTFILFKNKENNTEVEIFNVTEFKPVTEKLSKKEKFAIFGLRDIPKVRIAKVNNSDHVGSNKYMREENVVNLDKMKYEVFTNNCSSASVKEYNIDQMPDVDKITAILSLPTNIRDTQSESSKTQRQPVFYKNKH